MPMAAFKALVNFFHGSEGKETGPAFGASTSLAMPISLT
jgi:hypothetical protein